MNVERIKEIQKETAYPDSISVQQALFKVWNECEQEQQLKNCNLQSVSGSASDFWKDLMKLINSYCKQGLQKPDLVKKMEEATDNCRYS